MIINEYFYNLKFNSMGNTTKNLQQSSQSWTSICVKSFAPHQSYTVVLDSNRLMADEYIFQVDKRYSWDDEFQIYSKRMKGHIQSKHLVSILSAAHLANQYDCSGVRDSIRVRTQHIPWRLSLSHHDLTMLEAAYLLQGIFEGLVYLIKEYTGAPFFFSANMVGIDQNSIVKVWVNENFGKNHINQQYIHLTSCRAMVEQTFSMVRGQTALRVFDNFFQQLISEYQMLPIQKVVSKIKEYFNILAFDNKVTPQWLRQKARSSLFERVNQVEKNTGSRNKIASRTQIALVKREALSRVPKRERHSNRIEQNSIPSIRSASHEDKLKKQQMALNAFRNSQELIKTNSAIPSIPNLQINTQTPHRLAHINSINESKRAIQRKSVQSNCSLVSEGVSRYHILSPTNTIQSIERDMESKHILPLVNPVAIQQEKVPKFIQERERIKRISQKNNFLNKTNQVREINKPVSPPIPYRRVPVKFVFQTQKSPTNYQNSNQNINHFNHVNHINHINHINHTNHKNQQNIDNLIFKPGKQSHFHAKNQMPIQTGESKFMTGNVHQNKQKINFAHREHPKQFQGPLFNPQQGFNQNIQSFVYAQPKVLLQPLNYKYRQISPTQMNNFYVINNNNINQYGVLPQPARKNTNFPVNNNMESPYRSLENAMNAGQPLIVNFIQKKPEKAASSKLYTRKSHYVPRKQRKNSFSKKSHPSKNHSKNDKNQNISDLIKQNDLMQQKQINRKNSQTIHTKKNQIHKKINKISQVDSKNHFISCPSPFGQSNPVSKSQFQDQKQPSLNIPNDSQQNIQTESEISDQLNDEVKSSLDFQVRRKKLLFNKDIKNIKPDYYQQYEGDLQGIEAEYKKYFIDQQASRNFINSKKTIKDVSINQTGSSNQYITKTNINQTNSLEELQHTQSVNLDKVNEVIYNYHGESAQKPKKEPNLNKDSTQSQNFQFIDYTQKPLQVNKKQKNKALQFSFRKQTVSNRKKESWDKGANMEQISLNLQQQKQIAKISKNPNLFSFRDHEQSDKLQMQRYISQLNKNLSENFVQQEERQTNLQQEYSGRQGHKNYTFFQHYSNSKQ